MQVRFYSNFTWQRILVGSGSHYKGESMSQAGGGGVAAQICAALLHSLLIIFCWAFVIYLYFFRLSIVTLPNSRCDIPFRRRGKIIRTVLCFICPTLYRCKKKLHFEIFMNFMKCMKNVRAVVIICSEINNLHYERIITDWYIN